MNIYIAHNCSSSTSSSSRCCCCRSRSRTSRCCWINKIRSWPSVRSVLLSKVMRTTRRWVYDRRIIHDRFQPAPRLTCHVCQSMSGLCHSLCWHSVADDCGVIALMVIIVCFIHTCTLSCHSATDSEVRWHRDQIIKLSWAIVSLLLTVLWNCLNTHLLPFIIIIIHEFHRDASLETKLQGRYSGPIRLLLNWFKLFSRFIQCL